MNREQAIQSGEEKNLSQLIAELDKLKFDALCSKESDILDNDGCLVPQQHFLTGIDSLNMAIRQFKLTEFWLARALGVGV